MPVVEFPYSKCSTLSTPDISKPGLQTRVSPVPLRPHGVYPLSSMAIVNKEFLFHSLIKAGAWAAGPALVRADSWLTASPGPFISLYFPFLLTMSLTGYFWVPSAAEPNALWKSGYRIRCTPASCKSLWCYEVIKSLFFTRRIVSFKIRFPGLFIATYLPNFIQAYCWFSTGFVWGVFWTNGHMSTPVRAL